MATGLKIPVGVNQAGSAAIERDEVQHTDNMLVLALSTGGDDNPFQDLGLKKSLIFSIRNASFRAEAIQDIERILAKYSDRIALDPKNPLQFEDINDGEIEVSFGYVNIVTNEEQEFRERFTK
jgi:hypothetical protein